MFKVLVIDDEPWSREVVKALVQWDELELRLDGEAEDGTEGLRLIEEREPHIVVTDMRMPGLDGVGMLKRMNEKFPAMKIIVMSGYDDFVYLKQAIRSRAVEYLLKPIDGGELNAALALCVQELKQAEQTNNAPWRTSFFAFSDVSAQEQYTSLRQKMEGCLLELDSAAAIEVLEKLGELVESSMPDKEGHNGLAKLARDFLSMIEEFAAENELDVAGLWPKAPSGDWRNAAQAIRELRTIYAEAIEQIGANRRKRLRLDIAAIRAHIDGHYHEPISLEMIAQRFYVSKEHLSRAFKSEAGENLSDYILRKRMEKARELILEGKLSIKHVAKLTGYEDVAYFYRVFRKQFGHTPGDLRREDQGE
ncbi:response regulator transcription factor [Cohnella boryungensis]|uniref:Response regulator n=1 Tax=Cohnella boryungensis TaxID=768479 RepID=A0ABV8SA24_9BACL